VGTSKCCPRGWSCGFDPGSDPGECAGSTADTFDQARTGFEQAWAVFLSNRTEADFQEWRDARDWEPRSSVRLERGCSRGCSERGMARRAMIVSDF